MNNFKEQVKENSKKAVIDAFETSRMPVGVDELKEYITQLMNTLTLKDSDMQSGGINFFLELTALKNFISKMKQEMSEIVPDEIKSNFIPIATDELDEVVIATEEATNKILDCCEEIQTLALECEPEVKEKIEGLTTAIFEACNFQDITGQRITKVVTTLKHIEERVNELIASFESSGIESKEKGESKKITPNQSNDPYKDLINGPARTAEQKIDQDEIDRLLASLD